MAFPAAFAVWDALALAVQIINLAALRAPLAVLSNGPDGEHDVSVRVATTNSVTLNEMSQKRTEMGH